VTDEQYDALVEDAVDEYEGDLSKALRGALDASADLAAILSALDPHAALAEIINRRGREEARELYFEEFGEYPPE
jgi:hypothetical protein